MGYTLDVVLLSHFRRHFRQNQYQTLWLRWFVRSQGQDFQRCQYSFQLLLQFSSGFNFAQLSWRPGTERLIIEIVVFVEETIVDSIYVTKRQHINPIVKNVSFVTENVERHFINGYCMESVAARSFSMVLRADETTRVERFFESVMRQLSFGYVFDKFSWFLLPAI